MRTLRVAIFCFSLLFLASSTLLASDLRVRVVDPSSAVVAGAQVTVYADSSTPLAVGQTAADGSLVLRNLPNEKLRVRVQAGGFRPVESETSPESKSIKVQLSVASNRENVVVSADATPIEADKAASAVSSLNARELQLLDLPELSDNLRFLPGAYVSDAGQRGGLTTMFVRGGESTYNKVIVDGVPVNEDTSAGGSFNFGVVPTAQIDRVEMVRGAASTLYGSDAMTSVTQLWSGTGSTRAPEVRFGAEGGTFATARGFASVAGASGRFDYNAFGEQLNTDGQGVNDSFENATQGANLGMKMTDASALRLRVRHSNSRTGTPGDWLFSTGILPPDTTAYARQNDIIASLALTFAPTRNWENTLTGFEYNHRLRNVDDGADYPGRPYDSPYDSRDHFNRAGFDYQGELTERVWSRSIFGFHFEDENAFISDVVYGAFNHGLRRNTALFGEQVIDWKRLTLTGGVRWEHNESFGDKAIPRAAASFLVLRGGHLFSGTRLRGSYSGGIKAPTFEQNLGSTAYGVLPNPDLKPEQVRALEAGFVQGLFDNRWSFSALYFNNRFTDQIQYTSLDSSLPACVAGGFFFCSQYFNVNRALAHGAELELDGRITRHLTVSGSYTYTSTQALTGFTAGDPLQRRPKQLGSLLATYSGRRWGASVAGNFVGRRPDTIYEPTTVIPPITSVAGYALVNASGYRDINRHLTAFATIGNLLNRRYQEIAGYPAYKANFRAGMRFRFGGE